MVARFHTKLSIYLSIGSGLVAIFLMTGAVTDPVNAPKLFVLGGFSTALLAMLIYGYQKKILKFTSIEILALAFAFWSILISIHSKAPFTQNFYGSYGRNTGSLAYFCFVVIFLAASQVKHLENINRALLGFGVAGLANILYSTWVLLFGDFVGWNNNYGAILGTFGNPNFISSFLGLLFVACLVLLAGINSNKRYYFLALLPLLIWLLVKTNSIQGLVIAAMGFWVVGFFWIRSMIKTNLISWIYLLSGVILGFVAIQGALGSGPLRNFLAQPTVALREQYWYAAWKTGISNPLFGVGMDGFGDWYRRARGAQALISPGPDTVTNAAHNIFLDLFSSGGFPLLFLYLSMMFFCLKILIKISYKQRNFNTTFVATASLWICFQAQSIISINQIGLAIWGWLFSGLLIAYGRNLDTASTEEKSKKPQKKIAKASVISPEITALIGLVVGLVVSVPPLNADMKWRALQSSGKVDLLEPALTNSYLTPLNSLKLAQAVEILENSKLPELAIKYARKGVEFNPNFYTAWQMLYQATLSTPKEKQRAKLEMIRLDPLNMKLKQLP
jgi:O-antigen ligase